MIRKAEIKDAEKLLILMTDLEKHDFDQKSFKENLKALLSDPAYYYFVYETEDGVVAGIISLMIKHPLHHQGATGEILELIVDEQYRNQKIGEQLLLYTENLARETGLIQIELMSRFTRKDAHRFYQNHEYELLRYNFTKDL